MTSTHAGFPVIRIRSAHTPIWSYRHRQGRTTSYTLYGHVHPPLHPPTTFHRTALLPTLTPTPTPHTDGSSMDTIYNTRRKAKSTNINYPHALSHLIHGIHPIPHAQTHRRIVLRVRINRALMCLSRNEPGSWTSGLCDTTATAGDGLHQPSKCIQPIPSPTTMCQPQLLPSAPSAATICTHESTCVLHTQRPQFKSSSDRRTCTSVFPHSFNNSNSVSHESPNMQNCGRTRLVGVSENKALLRIRP
jgi:hypothetical protein